MSAMRRVAYDCGRRPLVRCAFRCCTSRASAHDTTPQEGEAAATSSHTRPRGQLLRAAWMRTHPVERWTMLVDLGRRGLHLIDQPHDLLKHTQHHNSDPGRFVSTAAVTHHAALCRELHPYVARVQLARSLLMWVQCLRTVQDTLARLRLPFAYTTRFRDAQLVHVFPTRLLEYWVDRHTTVSLKLNSSLNDTAEQVPAPHTWDPETSETLLDGVTTVTGHRPQHGDVGRETGGSMALLRRVQNITARPSEDDERARQASLSPRLRHRRLAAATRKALSNTKSSQTATGASSLAETTDGSRRLPASPMDPDPIADICYHGNMHRGEGCPLDDEGMSTPTPIFIPLQRVSGESRTTVELALDNCVRAHASILSSLFIEGRVAHVTTSDPVVYHYVSFIFAQLIDSKFVSAELVLDEPPTKGCGRLPFFPPWCDTAVWVLMPPRRSLFSASELKEIAAVIAQCSPCAVLTESGPCAAYVDQVKEAVAEQHAAIQWVSLRLSSSGNYPMRQEAKTSYSDHERAPLFTPRLPSEKASLHRSLWPQVTMNRILSPYMGRAGAPSSRSEAFLSSVSAAVENNFYSVQLAYAPHNSLIRMPRLRRWLWQELPQSAQLVSVNASATDALYFYPQACYLTQKVGNALRYRAIERTIIGRQHSGLISTDAFRYATTWFSKIMKARTPSTRFQSRLLLSERSTFSAPSLSDAQDCCGALQHERTLEYLADPSKLRLLALFSAKILRL